MSSPRLDGLSAAPPAARPKGPYLCKTCGKPKRGHQCIGEQTISQEGQQEDVNKENADKSAPSSDAVPSTTMVVEEGAVVQPHGEDNPSKEPQQENNSSSVAPPAATGEAQQGDSQFSKKQYLCGLCGQPKKGHKCTADRVISATMLAALPTTATPAAGGEAAAPPPRGRGRPPKRAVVETEEEEEQEGKAAEAPATETPAAKRGRGRPKKSERTGASPVAEKEEQREEEQMKEEEEGESNDVTTTEAPAVKRGRGRPRKNEPTTASHVVEGEKEKAEKNEEGPSTESTPAKRGRGRPPKKKLANETAAAAEEEEEEAVVVVMAQGKEGPATEATPAKRGRGRPPKKREQTTVLSPQDDETNEQANDTPVKKGRGRPKKRLESSSSSSSSESEKSANEMEEKKQQSMQLPTKRGRGRPRKNEKKTKDTKKSKRDSMKKEDEEDVEEPSIVPFLALLPHLPQVRERTERLSAPERRAKAAREAEEAKKAKASATNLTTTDAHSETKTEEKKVYLCSRCGEPKKGHVCNDPVEEIVESSENEEDSEGGGKSSKKRKGRRHVDHNNNNNNKPKEITKGVKQKTFARVLIGDLLNIPTSWRLDSLPLTQVSARAKLDAAATPLFPRWSTAPVLVDNVSLYHPSAVTSPPISIDEASPVSLPRFKCVPRKNGGCVLNCGGPISALDWLERPLESAAEAHFLAVAVLQTMDESHRIGRRYEGANMVQLWQCSSSPSSGITASFAGGIAHNGGFVIDLAWCPQSSASSLPTPRLGLLAACLGDGRIVVWSVPVPQQDKAAPIWNLKPVLEISCPPSATFSALRWAPASANCAVLLTSRTDGGVQLWNLLHAHDDKDDNNNISPIFNTPHHKSFVRAISFCPSSSLSNIRFASAGAEGTVNVWSAQEPCRATATFHITTPVADLFWANDETCCIAPEEAALGVFDVNVDDDVSFWPAHDAAVTRIDGQPDKPMLASASRDGTIQLYPLRKQPQPKCVFRLSVADSPQGSYAVDSKAAAAKAAAYTPTPGMRQYFPSPSIATTAVRWNPNPSASSWLAAGTALGLVALLNTNSTKSS